MPELPEVETIVNQLNNGSQNSPSIIGLEISKAIVLWERSISTPEANNFAEQVKRKKIQKGKRRGKYLHFPLDNGHLIFHLRMSGDLFVKKEEEKSKNETQYHLHDRLVLRLTENNQLVFNDPRKFGRVWYLEDPNVLFKKLGPEPFDPELTCESFYQKIQSKRCEIKPLLLNQGFLAGMGNIYTDEALYLASIHPKQISNKINKDQSDRLLESIQSVLSEGIMRNGASIDWVYRGGNFQNYFRVYQKTGQPCSVCGTCIEKIFVGQRGTHFCPHCQKINHR